MPTIEEFPFIAVGRIVGSAVPPAEQGDYSFQIDELETHRRFNHKRYEYDYSMRAKPMSLHEMIGEETCGLHNVAEY